MEPGCVLGGAGCGVNAHHHHLGDMQMKSRYHIAHIADELGAFIHQWSWNLFITLTFRARFPMSSDRVRSQWKRLISSINRGQRTDCYWVQSIETGKEQVIPHIHALVGGTDISPREIARLWHPNTGNAKAETYDPDRRAAWYIAKNPDPVEFSSNLVLPEK